MTDSLEILEDVINIIKEQYPNASKEEIVDAFVGCSSEIADIIITKFEEVLSGAVRDLSLPSEMDVRVDYKKAMFRAKRSRALFRIELINEAESTKRVISELRTWQRYYAEKGETLKADDYAKSISQIEMASSTKEQLINSADNDLTGNIIIRREELEERGQRSIRALQELVSDDTRE
jgi:hypothetical protein